MDTNLIPKCHLCGLEKHQNLIECHKFNFAKYEGRIAPDLLENVFDTEEDYTDNTYDENGDHKPVKKVARGPKVSKLTRFFNESMAKFVGLPFSCEVIQRHIRDQKDSMTLALHYDQLRKRWQKFSAQTLEVDVALENKEKLGLKYKANVKAQPEAVWRALEEADEEDTMDLKNKLYGMMSPYNRRECDKITEAKKKVDLNKPRWWQVRIDELEAENAKLRAYIRDKIWEENGKK